MYNIQSKSPNYSINNYHRVELTPFEHTGTFITKTKTNKTVALDCITVYWGFYFLGQLV